MLNLKTLTLDLLTEPKEMEFQIDTITDRNPNALFMLRNKCGEHVAPPVTAISVVVTGNFNSFCLAIRSMCIVGVPLTIVHLEWNSILRKFPPRCIQLNLLLSNNRSKRLLRIERR